MHLAAQPPAVPSFSAVATPCGATVTVTVAGELDLASADRLYEVVDPALDQAPELLVVDLGPLEFVDSTGIRTLIGIHRKAVARGVHLVILPAPDAVQRVFRMCDLEDLLPFVPAERGPRAA